MAIFISRFEVQQEIIELIVNDLHGSEPFERIARRHGVSSATVRNVAVDRLGYRVRSQDGLGEASLRRYIIATKHIDHPWPEEDASILEARVKYDDGLVEICTAVDGVTCILYAIPRRRQDRGRRAYFSRNFGDET